MAARNELVYDEDDYVPQGYMPPKPSGGRRKSLVAVVILGLIIGVFLVSFVMRSRVRSRDADVLRARAAQKALIESRQSGVARAMGPADDSFPPRPSENWSRIVGTWSRTPGLDEENTFPIRFEMRANQTATVTHRDDTSREARMIILREGQNSIEMEAHPLPSDPTSGTGILYGHYRFSFKTDGTIVLDAQMGGPVFVRFR